MLNRAIVAVVGIIALGLVVDLRRQAPQIFQLVACPPLQAAAQPKWDARQAQSELAILEDSRRAVQRTLDLDQTSAMDSRGGEIGQAHRNVLVAARAFAKRTPEWRVALQQVASGDTSAEAVAAMHQAVRESKQQRQDWLTAVDALSRAVDPQGYVE